jgi:predicted lipoprotein with Yx(FWY)xxD motif
MPSPNEPVVRPLVIPLRPMTVRTRYLAAAAVLTVGLDHLLELWADHYASIPTIGPLFAANFGAAALIACGLLAPVERLPGRAGRAAAPLLALGGIGLAAGSLAGLLVSERTTLFGFMETGYRPAVVLAIALDVLAIAALAVHLAVRRGVSLRVPGGLLVAVLAATGVVVAGGGTSHASSHGSARPAMVDVRGTSLGSVLVDAHGRTLYLFEKDRNGSSSCYSACAGLWPPVTSATRAVAGAGADAAKLGSADRSDGTSIVTYGGHALYTYAGDRHPGDVSGQGLDQFGARWYAVAPSGRTIKADRALRASAGP